MALSEPLWQDITVAQPSLKTSEKEFHSLNLKLDNSDLSTGPSRAMQPGLKFQDNSSMLEGEDVEVFFKTLEAPHEEQSSEHDSEKSVNSDLSPDIDTDIRRDQKLMFQNSMHAVPVPGGAPTYHDIPGTGSGAITSMHSSGVNPVYVPTTRAVLPPMHYMTNGAAQSVSSANSAAMWPINSDTSYSTANPHASVSPRFGFAPAPSSPISTPTGRSDSSFAPPLARPSGISPYHTYMPSPEISQWNFQMAIQQGRLQTGPGNYHDYPKYWDRQPGENSVDPDQTAPLGAV